MTEGGKAHLVFGYGRSAILAGLVARFTLSKVALCDSALEALQSGFGAKHEQNWRFGSRSQFHCCQSRCFRAMMLEKSSKQLVQESFF